MILANVGHTILTIVLFLVGLTFVVSIHELGHFSMAKTFNVYCQEFSIGFGPKIISKKRKNGETYFSLRAIPLGGFVSMYGESEEALDPSLDIPKERSLTGVAKWKRAIIMVAGVTLNFILALLLFAINRTICPQNIGTTQVLVQEGSEASTAGLLSYDTINSFTKTAVIDGETKDTYTYNCENYYDVWDNMDYTEPSTVDDKITFVFNVTHKDTEATDTITLTISAYMEDSESRPTWKSLDSYGLSGYTYKARLKFGYGMKLAFQDFGNGFTMIGKAIGELFIGKGYENVGGPLALFKTSQEALDIGFGTYIFMWGLISVNLGLFNLLPFPGLDGWHLLVVVVEAITHKEIPSKVKQIISFVGMILLFALMALVFVKDIINFTGVIKLIA